MNWIKFWTSLRSYRCLCDAHTLYLISFTSTPNRTISHVSDTVFVQIKVELSSLGRIWLRTRACGWALKVKVKCSTQESDLPFLIVALRLSFMLSDSRELRRFCFLLLETFAARPILWLFVMIGYAYLQSKLRNSTASERMWSGTAVRRRESFNP